MASGLSWAAPGETAAVAEGYRNGEARLRRSLVLRIGSRDLVEREATLAREASRVLFDDAAYAEVPPVSHTGLDGIVAAFGAKLLVPPPYGAKDAYDAVRCTDTGELVGAVHASFVELATGSKSGRWPGVDRRLASVLDGRVADASAARAAGRPLDYNGRRVRLRNWRVEVSHTSPHARIHLLVDETNFATVLATRPDLAESDEERRVVGLPIAADRVSESLAWLRGNAAAVASGGLTTSVLTFASVVGRDELVRLWDGWDGSSRDAAVDRRELFVTS